MKTVKEWEAEQRTKPTPYTSTTIQDCFIIKWNALYFRNRKGEERQAVTFLQEQMTDTEYDRESFIEGIEDFLFFDAGLDDGEYIPSLYPLVKNLEKYHGITVKD